MLLQGTTVDLASHKSSLKCDSINSATLALCTQLHVLPSKMKSRWFIIDLSKCLFISLKLVRIHLVRTAMCQLWWIDEVLNVKHWWLPILSTWRVFWVWVIYKTGAYCLLNAGYWDISAMICFVCNLGWSSFTTRQPGWLRSAGVSPCTEFTPCESTIIHPMDLAAICINWVSPQTRFGAIMLCDGSDL